jgi:hypothetical protein
MTRDDLLALGTQGVCLVGGVALGALMWGAGFALLYGLDWNEPTPGGVWGLVFIAGMALFGLAGLLLGTYGWMRIVRGRVSAHAVRKLIESGPDIPVLTRLSRRWYATLYEPSDLGY